MWGGVVSAVISVYVQLAPHSNIWLFFLVYMPGFIWNGNTHNRLNPLLVRLYITSADIIMGTLSGVLLYVFVNVLVKCVAFMRAFKGFDLRKKGDYEK